jgi:lipopolysaccharide heptosyltransferase II
MNDTARAARWNAARRTLCVRLDTLGDILMTSPALRALKESVPSRSISLLTSSAGREIAALIPEIQETIVYDSPWMKATAPRADSRPEYEMAERLRAARFDAAVIFTVYSQSPLPSALLCYLADIPLRLAHCRENPYQLLSDWVPEPEPDRIVRHEVRRQLDLVQTVGCSTRDERLSLAVPPEARSTIDLLLRGLGLGRGGRWMVIHPGASAPSRRYSPQGFAEAARTLAGEGYKVIFTGTNGESELVREIQEMMGVSSLSLAGKLRLAEMAALLERTPLLISNNTGPAHMAAALKTPVVDLYALTNPQHTPWAVAHRVLYHDVPCKYCYKSVCPEGHHNCLNLVRPEQVVTAARELLAETSGPAGRRQEMAISNQRTAKSDQQLAISGQLSAVGSQNPDPAG